MVGLILLRVLSTVILATAASLAWRGGWLAMLMVPVVVVMTLCHVVIERQIRDSP